MDPLLAPLLAASLKQPLQDLYESASGPVKTLVKKWKVAGAIDNVCQKITDIELVPTMFKHEPTRLSSFYYPSRIVVTEKGRKGASIAVNKITDISENANIVMIGTLGQGKSMLMRYLCIQELKEGKHIPLFLELRALDEVLNLKGLIIQGLRRLGFTDITEEAFEFIMQRGCLSIFLDGFDEVKREFAMSLKNDLFQLMIDFPKIRFVISSRPGGLLGLLIQAPNLRIVSLDKLKKEDFQPFFSRLGLEDVRITHLLKAIDTSAADIQAVLTTPLMLTLLNEIFGTSANIPDTLHYFYESMFAVLVQRHDQLKVAFARQRATQLNNLELQEAFECFSYLSKDFGVSLSDDQFAQCAKDVGILSGKDLTPDGLKTDFTEAVCLMMPDGLKTAFIHKSIQEFFAAFYLSHMKDETTVKALYETFRNERLAQWHQELIFLEKMDNIRFLKYYRIPQMEAFLKNVGFNADNKTIVSKINFKKFVNSLNSIVITIKDLPRPHVALNVDAQPFSALVAEVFSHLNPGVILPLGGNEISGLSQLPNISTTSLGAHLQKNFSDEVHIKKFRDFCIKVHRDKLRFEKHVASRQTASRSILFRNQDALRK